MAPISSPVPSADTNASRTPAMTEAGRLWAPAGCRRCPTRWRAVARVLAGSWGSRLSMFERPRVAISAPMTATPKVPPTMRLIDSTPEAAPALVRSTEFIAAVLIGDMTSPMPRPMSTKPGSSRG